MYSCSRGAMSFSSIEIRALFAPQLLMIDAKLQEQIYQQLENIFPHCIRHMIENNDIPLLICISATTSASCLPKWQLALNSEAYQIENDMQHHNSQKCVS